MATKTIEEMHRFDLAADQLASHRLRRELEALEYEFEDETVELLKLTTTELVTNSVRHSGTSSVVVFVRVGAPSLLVKVCDQGPGVEAEVSEPDPFAEGGRGLFLVEQLSREWGTSKLSFDGREWACVWACFGSEKLPVCSTSAVG